MLNSLSTESSRSSSALIAIAGLAGSALGFESAFRSTFGCGSTYDLGSGFGISCSVGFSLSTTGGLLELFEEYYPSPRKMLLFLALICWVGTA